MRSPGIFERRVRGFRVVEIGALAVLLALILTVYLAKTGAGGKRADIDRIQDQIADEQVQLRLLRAEVANLERPERLEALSDRYLGLAPISARREVTPEGLADVARVSVDDNKPLPGVADPLTQPGSPDLPPGAKPSPAPSGPKPAAPDVAASAGGADAAGPN
jgi:cell division protein FtsL